MKERIQKILASAGVASRRNIEEMVRQGRIAVNGKIVWQLPVLVDPVADRIEVDGERIKLSADSDTQRMYFLLNKPKNVHCTNVAQGEQIRAIDLLPRNIPGRVYPVARLDAASQGLLLLTNDGELTNQLTHPRFGVPKTYRAVVDGFVDAKTLQALSEGVWLSDPHSGKGFKTGKSRISVVKRSRDLTILVITLREGRNHPVRRMLARAGHKVRELTRIRMGALSLGKLEPGQFRKLSSQEVARLKLSFERAQSGRGLP